MGSNSVTTKHIPFPIATITIPGMDGLIGITSCPGLRDLNCSLDLYEESLLQDMTTIRNWGAGAVVTLLDSLEMRINGVSDLPNTAEWLNLHWFHLPVDNKGIPGRNFELLWDSVGPQLCQLLREGKRIVVHCKEGIGRSGVIAARLLIELGTPSEQAIKMVQKAKPESLRLYSQEKYCHSLSVAG
jgi:ADP-ribosyl-[dinitrogen reductase] hydrolase